MPKPSWSFDRKISGTVLIGLIGLIITFFSWVAGIERKLSVLEMQINQLITYQEDINVRQDEDFDRIESIVIRILEHR